MLSGVKNIRDICRNTGTIIQHGIELMEDADDSWISQALMRMNPVIQCLRYRYPIKLHQHSQSEIALRSLWILNNSDSYEIAELTR